MGKGPDHSADELGKDEIIRRMKILSLSQSAFLKDYVGKKIKCAKDLVNSALIALKNEGASSELINALADLNIDNLLSVDVKSSQLMMHEEMALLRSAIESGTHSMASSIASSEKFIPSEGDSASKERVEKLEAENANLKSLLKELKEELVAGNAQNQSSSGANEELVSLRDSTKSIEAELKKTQEDLAATKSAYEILEGEHKALKEAQASLQNGTAASMEEMSSLKAEVATLTTKLENAGKEAEQSTKNLEKFKLEAEQKAASLEKENEAEKEEMMNAMAQELEETEVRHTKEVEALKKEVKKLNKSLAKYENTSKALSSGLIPVRKSMIRLNEAQKSLSKTVREEMDNTLKEVSSHFGSSLMKRLKGADKKLVDITLKWKKEMAERKRLHNVVQELKGNIRVFMRCRPPSTKEIEMYGGEESVCVSNLGEGEVKVHNEKGREKTWEFDEVFHVDSTQEQVYAEVSDLIISVLDGYNVCIFAYGQTGSGKTYTMTGPEESKGVNIRALGDLFEKSGTRAAEWKDTIAVSVLEVYNEAINDLLVSGGGDRLEVKQGPQGNHVPGLTQVPVSNLQEVQRLLQVADKNRSQACTNMNEHSSRSHMMLTVTISSEHKETRVVTRGKLNLVDLAGSERLDKSGATGQALKEAQNINKSLSSLGDVIAARAQKQGHIPFRNSTLTYLLQDSLSQDSKTLMFVCVSPVIYNAEETFCSLNFASRVRSVELGKATKNISGGKSQSKRSSAQR